MQRTRSVCSRVTSMIWGVGGCGGWSVSPCLSVPAFLSSDTRSMIQKIGCHFLIWLEPWSFQSCPSQSPVMKSSREKCIEASTACKRSVDTNSAQKIHFLQQNIYELRQFWEVFSSRLIANNDSVWTMQLSGSSSSKIVCFPLFVCLLDFFLRC